MSANVQLRVCESVREGKREVCSNKITGRERKRGCETQSCCKRVKRDVLILCARVLERETEKSEKVNERA